jgi:molecular chaperone GrpE
MSKKAVKDNVSAQADEIPLRAEDMDAPETSAPQAASKSVKALEKEVSEIKQALEAAEEKAQGNWDRLLRKEAELQNVQRRAEQSIQEARQFALKGFVQDLLGVLDSFDKGLEIAQEADPALAEGMQLTCQMLVNTLEKYHVTVLNPEGEAFDPQRHEALTMQPSSDIAPNHVVTVVQKGYLLHGRVVRPAKVIVSAAK